MRSGLESLQGLLERLFSDTAVAWKHTPDTLQNTYHRLYADETTVQR